MVQETTQETGLGGAAAGQKQVALAWTKLVPEAAEIWDPKQK